MKIALVAASVLAAVVVAVLVVGALLPARHVATRSAVVAAPIDAVFATLLDVAAAPTWRADVTAVTMLPPRDGHVCWRERSNDRDIPYERVLVEEQAPRRIVNRIATDELPFGGTWTFELTPEGDSTRVTITEHGEVKNVLFRFVSRFVLGHTRTMDATLAALERKHGAPPTPR